MKAFQGLVIILGDGRGGNTLTGVEHQPPIGRVFSVTTLQRPTQCPIFLFRIPRFLHTFFNSILNWPGSLTPRGVLTAAALFTKRTTPESPDASPPTTGRRFDEEDKQLARGILEGLILKHQAKQSMLRQSAAKKRNDAPA